MWVRLDDAFFTHRKVINLSKDAKLLFMAGLTYAAQRLSDGQLTIAEVRIAAAMVDVDPEIADDLVAADLWEPIEGGFRIHDFLDYNPSREQVEQQRAGNASRQERYRRRHSQHTNGVTHGVTNDPNPVPLRTDVPVPGSRGARAREDSPPAEGGSDDPGLDALCVGLFGKSPALLMPSERDKAADAANELAGEGVEPAEIQERAAAFRTHWPHLTPSPRAVVQNWTRLGELVAEERPPDAPHQPDHAYAETKRRLLAEAGLGPDADGLPDRAGRDAAGPDRLSGLPQPARGP